MINLGALIFVCVFVASSLSVASAAGLPAQCDVVGKLITAYPALGALWTDPDCCNWQSLSASIRCGTNPSGSDAALVGSVTEILIQDLAISGPLPVELGTLPNLWRLELKNVAPRRSALTATKPNLSILEKTNLNISQWSDSFFSVKLRSNPMMSGQILDVIARNCSARPLYELLLQDLPGVSGQLSDSFTSAGACFGLVTLHLANTPIEGTLGPLGSLQDLEFLSIEKMPLLTGGIPILSSKLRFFQASQCPNLSDDIFARLGACCASLTDIWASSSGFYGNIPDPILDSLPNLTSIDVGYNKLNGTIPASLMSQPLIWMFLGHNNFTGEVPLPLPRSLQGFSLQGSNGKNFLVSDQLINDMTHLPNLTVVYIDGQPGLTGEIPANFSTSLSKLVDCWLSWCNFSGTISPSWGSMVDLKKLSLSGNRLITGPIPPELGNAVGLELLELSWLDLNGSLPDALGNLINMKYFDVGNNYKLEGPFPPWIETMTGLASLDLSSNNFTGPIPTWLSTIPSLTKLFLNDNRFTGCPDPFYQVTQDCQLHNNPWDGSCDISLICFPPIPPQLPPLSPQPPPASAPITVSGVSTCEGSVCTLTCQQYQSCSIQGSVEIAANTTTTLKIDSSIVITGNLTIPSGVVIQFVFDSTSTGSTAVRVDQCLNLGSNQFDILFGQNANLTALNQSVLVSWSASCSQVSSDIHISSNLDSCNQLKPSTETQTSGERGQLALVFLPLDAASSPGCGATSQSGSILSTNAIIGIAVGAAVFFVVVVLIVVFSVRAIRQKAMPFHDRQAAQTKDDL